MRPATKRAGRNGCARKGAKSNERDGGLRPRLHLRYDGQHFPEDLVFQETGDRSNFQGRYVLRHPWTGKADCPAGKPRKCPGLNQHVLIEDAATQRRGSHAHNVPAHAEDEDQGERSREPSSSL